MTIAKEMALTLLAALITVLVALVVGGFALLCMAGIFVQFVGAVL